MQQHQCALDGAFQADRDRRRIALRRAAARPGAGERLCDALLRLRVRPPAPPLFGLADARASQHRLADRARARAQALRRAGARRKHSFWLADERLRATPRWRHGRGRERHHRRAAKNPRPLPARHRRRRQRGAQGARLRHGGRRRHHASRLHGRHHAVQLHPRPDPDGGEPAAAHPHDLDHQSRDAGDDVCAGRARNLGRPLPGAEGRRLAHGRRQGDDPGHAGRRRAVRHHLGRTLDRRPRAGGRALPVGAGFPRRRCGASVHAARRARHEHRHRRRHEFVLEDRGPSPGLGRAASRRHL